MKYLIKSKSLPSHRFIYNEEVRSNFEDIDTAQETTNAIDAVKTLEAQLSALDSDSEEWTKINEIIQAELNNAPEELSLLTSSAEELNSAIEQGLRPGDMLQNFLDAYPSAYVENGVVKGGNMDNLPASVRDQVNSFLESNPNAVDSTIINKFSRLKGQYPDANSFKDAINNGFRVDLSADMADVQTLFSHLNGEMETGMDMKAGQRVLQKLELYNRDIDGFMGEGTLAAYRQFVDKLEEGVPIENLLQGGDIVLSDQSKSANDDLNAIRSTISGMSDEVLKIPFSSAKEGPTAGKEFQMGSIAATLGELEWSNSPRKMMVVTDEFDDTEQFNLKNLNDLQELAKAKNVQVTIRVLSKYNSRSGGEITEKSAITDINLNDDKMMQVFLSGKAKSNDMYFKMRSAQKAETRSQ